MFFYNYELDKFKTVWLTSFPFEIINNIMKTKYNLIYFRIHLILYKENTSGDQSWNRLLVF